MTPLAEARQVSQRYGATQALLDASCAVMPGARIALLGASGSGKSTLLHLLGGLETPTQGLVDWPALGSGSRLRPRQVAFVFQAQSLLAPLTALENAALPLLLLGDAPDHALKRARVLLERLDLGQVLHQLPEELSGGQAQRVAVARALVTEPALILADEPTGQLDSRSAQHLMDVLLSECDRLGTALVVATHDARVAARLSDVWRMHHGALEATVAA